jgi:dolichyl-phosphate-mannose--protein O-mannosyl transferase
MIARVSAVYRPDRHVAAGWRWRPAMSWPRTDLVTAVLVTTCALALYLWRLDQPPTYIYDEVYHAYTAAQLAAGNSDAYLWHTEPPEEARALRLDYEWVHPALAKLLMQAGIVGLGDNPLGWRVASAVFGALGVGLLYVLGRALFDSTVGLFSATLLLLDGLWLVQARTAMNDVFVAVFVVLAYLALFLYLRTSSPERLRLVWSIGLALGLAVATKWSALYSFALVAALIAGREAWLGRQGGLRNGLQTGLVLAGALIVVPAALYVGGYAQFFIMGHTWDEWRELQWQIWRYHSGLRACHDWSSPAWTWPFIIRPVWYHAGRFPDGTVANVFAMGNPLIWWMFLSATAVVGIRWLTGRCRSIGLALVLLGFFGQWLPWLVSPRISFLYHMLPSVPFGCLAIACVLGGLRGNRLVVGGYLALVALTFAFFYSHFAALPVAANFVSLHDWLPTWTPGSAWTLGCPANGA